MMIMSMPAAFAIFAALIFVVIPPVPSMDDGPAANFSICSSIFSTTLMKTALSFLLGSLSKSPSMSERMTSRSAFATQEIIAESESFSPISSSSSSIATVSF